MDVASWVQNSLSEIKTDPVRGSAEALYNLYEGAWRNTGKTINFGDSIWTDDWDVLVVIDSCRHDLFEEVHSEFEWLDETEGHISNASSSAEWIKKNFHAEKWPNSLSETVYVSGNPFTDNVLYEKTCSNCGGTWTRRTRWKTVNDVCQSCGEPTASVSRTPAHNLRELIEVWDYAWDYDAGTIQPRPVTDAAIQAARESSPDRLVIHYMQPHYPLVDDDYKASVEVPFDELDGRTPWDRLRRGELPLDELWDAYKHNLRVVLEEVELLLDNVDGDVVITADHGNAIGEWGLYGHIMYAPATPIKKVPWCYAEGTDQETHIPAEYSNDSDTVNEELLEDLGYI